MWPGNVPRSQKEKGKAIGREVTSKKGAREESLMGTISKKEAKEENRTGQVVTREDGSAKAAERQGLREDVLCAEVTITSQTALKFRAVARERLQDAGRMGRARGKRKLGVVGRPTRRKFQALVHPYSSARDAAAAERG